MNKVERLRIPAEIAIAALVAYLLGYWFTNLFPGYLPKIGGLWSAISAIVVTQASRQETSSSASLRILGSAIGAGTSAIYLTLLPFHPLGMAVAIFATVALCAAIKVSSHGRLDPKLSPVLNALLRLAESCIGTGVAVLAARVWPSSINQAGGNS